MKISIIGTGYVGLVNGACIAEMGNEVTCIDINEEKINNLKKGIIPIYEPGLDEIIKRNVSRGRLKFSSDYSSIKYSNITFIAVGTPPDEDGSADLKYVISAAREFGKNVLSERSIIVTKSTVPVGTSEIVKETVNEELAKRNFSNLEFAVVSNPEFLKEGSAVKDCLYPDRIVIGIDKDANEWVINTMSSLYYQYVIKSGNIVYTDIPSAEMIKYASNSMLATRISFMNEIANLCEKVGANVDDVRKGMGSDSRIGNSFLYAGCGYGGSCFPKDVKALINTASKNGVNLKVLNSVEEVNKIQKEIPFNKLRNYYNEIGEPLNGKTIAILGLSFKPETDDMREATSLVTIDLLLKAGCKVKVYDPIAMGECKRRIGNIVEYCKDEYDAITGSDAFMLITEWREFRSIDFYKVKSIMKGNVVIDGRNIYNRKMVEQNGLKYFRIG